MVFILQVTVVKWDKMDSEEWCSVCESKSLKSKLKLFQTNLTEAIKLCSNVKVRNVKAKQN